MAAGLTLVTGGGRGYGAVIARHLAAAGVKVAVLGRDGAAVSRVSDEIAGVPVVADILDQPRIDEAIADLVSDHGPVNVLINNAGVSGTFGLAWEVERNEWWRTIEVNVRGAHNVTAAVLPAMIGAGGGRIINVVSHAGTVRWPYGSAYAVSKAALIKYGENLAAEVRKLGVVVLNYHPGILEIGLTETVLAKTPAPGSVHAMVADWLREQIAAGRSVDTDLSAATLVRLALGDADALSGRYLTAHDDLDEILSRATEISSSNLYTLGLLEP
jgi:NAD(P)-dependent dehydrogenase (short-subunit alcohol dehydrogenase family)